MRHRKRVVKLGRMSSHRNAMFNNMAASMVVHKKIYTTLPKAKALIPVIDKLITWAKEGSLHSRRLAFRILKDRSLVKQLFGEVVSLAAGRSGGYTRIIKAGLRRGDGAQMAFIELIGQELLETKDTKKENKKNKKTEAVQKKEEKVKEKDKKKAKEK